MRIALIVGSFVLAMTHSVVEAQGDPPGAWSPEARVPIEIGIGVGTLAIGFVAGWFIADDRCGAGWYCSSARYEGAVTGAGLAWLAVPALTALALDGHARGHAGGAYLGWLVSTALGIGIVVIGALVAYGGSAEAGVILYGLGVAAAVAGPIVGYELTDTAARASLRVAVSDRGASIALVGAF